MKTKQEIKEEIVRAVNLAKENMPLTPSITNTVTSNFVANAQLAVGGSAAMVNLAEEAMALAKVSGAFYINMGTLLPICEESMIKTSEFLRSINKPWVLDPVGVGFGGLRSNILNRLKDFKPTVIRANASEIIALANLWGLKDKAFNSKGVDAKDLVDDAKDSAIALAKYTKGAVAVSGAVDLVTDGDIIAYCYGGSPLMEKVTGCGCSLGGVVAVYSSFSTPLIAALTGTLIYNLAGNRAEESSYGTGSFTFKFIDALYNASAEDIANTLFNIEEA